MARVGKTGRGFLFPGWRFAGLVGLASTLALSACANFVSGSTGAPVEVALDAPIDEIDEGVRLAPPVNTWDGYGEAVDVCGDVLVIGTSERNHYGPGLANVYRLSGSEWQEEAQLTASDRDTFISQAKQYEGQGFGSSVAAGDGIIAIGAPGNAYPMAGGYAGAVYVFEYDGQAWTETAKLTPDHVDQDTAQKGVDWLPGRRAFGGLVALDGDTLAVGGDSGTDSVYIFQRDESGWQKQARVPVPGLPGRDLYMVSLALYGDTLALSAYYLLPQSEQTFVLAGTVTVYVFERAGNAWEESFRFVPEEGDADLLFLPGNNVGASVAVGGSAGQARRLAIGLPGFPDWSRIRGAQAMRLWGANQDPPEIPESNRQAGAVYVFERTANGGWKQQAILKPAGWENPPGPGILFSNSPSAGTLLQTPPPPTPGLGSSSSDSLSATSEAQGTGDVASVMAYSVFPGDVFSDNPEISFFGATVDLDEDRLAVTAGFANATYVFQRQGQDWAYRFRITPPREGEGLWEDYAQVVRISSDTLLLGTPSEFGNSAYVFRLPTSASDPAGDEK